MCSHNTDGTLPTDVDTETCSASVDQRLLLRKLLLCFITIHAEPLRRVMICDAALLGIPISPEVTLYL